jgi:1,2-diacylglycerol 3-alpha-glucosyltransferase
MFFASMTETQGLVVAEAMAAGLPVVAVNDLAVADAVSDGANGILTAEDPQALAAAADKVLSDPALRSRMSAESLRHAEALSIDRQAARLTELYEQLLADHPSPRRGGLRRSAVGTRVMRQIGSLRRRGSRLVRRYL